MRVYVSEKKETKKKRRKEPTREREREWRGFPLSLLPPFPEKSEKDDDASDKRRTRGRCFYFSPSFHTPCARGRVFIYAKAARRLDFFFPSYPKRDREKMHFFPNRARERARREREREKRLKERERRERVLRTEKKRRPRWVR